VVGLEGGCEYIAGYAKDTGCCCHSGVAAVTVLSDPAPALHVTLCGSSVSAGCPACRHGRQSQVLCMPGVAREGSRCLMAAAGVRRYNAGDFQEDADAFSLSSWLATVPPRITAQVKRPGPNPKTEFGTPCCG